MKVLDKGGAFVDLLTDLSKGFDCLQNELLIAKLKLVYDYLYNRKQWVKVGGTYRSWWEILYEVPQGSIIGPLLFNIFLSDVLYFFKGTDTASYADDNTPYNANLA